MRRILSACALMGTALVIVTLTLGGPNPNAVGQEPAAAEPAAKTADAAPKVVKKFRGRLPNYYSQVVDAKQRAAIYAIQKDYASKIAQLQEQLAAIIQEKNDKVRTVLSIEQQKKVDDLAAQAKAKRAQKKADQ